MEVEVDNVFLGVTRCFTFRKDMDPLCIMLAETLTSIQLFRLQASPRVRLMI
jgi:hypothetical protein